MKRQGVLLPPPPPPPFILLGGDGHQEHNAVPRPGFEPGPFDSMIVQHPTIKPPTKHEEHDHCCIKDF